MCVSPFGRAKELGVNQTFVPGRYRCAAGPAAEHDVVTREWCVPGDGYVQGFRPPRWRCEVREVIWDWFRNFCRYTYYCRGCDRACCDQQSNEANGM